MATLRFAAAAPTVPLCRLGAVSVVIAAALLAGCATRSTGIVDGPDPNPPAGLDRIADAVPRIEPLRIGGPNKPYEIFGQRYVPVTADEPLVQSGLASWYGRKFHGRPTSSGEIYDMHAMTAAHKTMPIPSYARVRNPANGREVVVRINDRGPFSDGRIIDLSYAAALRLDLLRGVSPVQVERLTFAQIRAGIGVATAMAAQASGSPPASSSQGAPIEWVTPVRVSAAGVPSTSPSTVPPMASTAVPVPVPVSAVTPVAVAVAVALPVTPAAPPAVAALSQAEVALAADLSDGPMLSGWWLQLGAFRQREGAMQLQMRAQRELPEGGVDMPAVAIFEGDALYRVQVGPYASSDSASMAAARLRQGTGVAPMLVERGAGGRPLAAR